MMENVNKLYSNSSTTIISNDYKMDVKLIKKNKRNTIYIKMKKSYREKFEVEILSVPTIVWTK